MAATLEHIFHETCSEMKHILSKEVSISIKNGEIHSGFKKISVMRFQAQPNQDVNHVGRLMQLAFQLDRLFSDTAVQLINLILDMLISGVKDTNLLLKMRYLWNMGEYGDMKPMFIVAEVIRYFDESLSTCCAELSQLIQK